MMALQAKCNAVKEEAQALSKGTLGPCKSNLKAIDPESAEITLL
jgi:hypothetical protein